MVTNSNTAFILYVKLGLPGGPNSRQPFGGVIPTLKNISGFNRGNSITYGEKRHNQI